MGKAVFYGDGWDDVNFYSNITQNCSRPTHLPLDGPTLALSYDELAVIALSGIAPLCIPRLLRQFAATLKQVLCYRTITYRKLSSAKQHPSAVYQPLRFLTINTGVRTTH